MVDGVGAVVGVAEDEVLLLRVDGLGDVLPLDEDVGVLIERLHDVHVVVVLRGRILGRVDAEGDLLRALFIENGCGSVLPLVAVIFDEGIDRIALAVVSAAAGGEGGEGEHGRAAERDRRNRFLHHNSPYQKIFLVLERADHDALCEELLHEGIEAEHGKARNDDRDVLELVGEAELFENGLARTARRRLGSRQDLLQDELQGEEIGVLKEDHGVEVAVPLPHRVVEREHRHDGHGEGQDDGDEEAQPVRAVEFRRLDDAVRNARLEEGLCHEQVPRRDRPRKDDGQRVVEHPQIADHLVEGNEAAAEEHGDREEDHPELAEGQRLAGERPRGRHRKDDREDGVGKRVPDGVAVTDPDVRALETADIAREINIDGKEIHFAREHGVRTREGGNDDEVERVDNEERKEEKHEVDDRVVDAVSAALPDAVFLRLFVLLHTAGDVFGCRSHDSTSSEERVLGELARARVRDDEQDEVDDRVEEADRRRIALAEVLDALLVDVGRDDLTRLKVAVRLHQEHLLVPDAHEPTDGHDEHDRDDGCDGGEVDVQHALEAGSAVDGGRLMLRRVDARERRKVHDGAPPEVLPVTRKDVHGTERT